jgi:hypothetical protein
VVWLTPLTCGAAFAGESRNTELPQAATTTLSGAEELRREVNRKHCVANPAIRFSLNSRFRFWNATFFSV